MSTENSHIDIILFRFLEGNAGEAEQKELLDWVKASKENEHYYIKQSNIYKTIKAESIDINIDKALKTVKQKNGVNVSAAGKATSLLAKKMLISGFFIASALAAATIYLLSAPDEKPEAVEQQADNYIEQIYISTDTIEDIVLEDSVSFIYLNSHSKLKYTRTDTSRVAELHGNALFDIKADAHRPFIILSDDIEVQSYGSKFEMETDSVNHTVSVTSIEGKTVVFNKEENTETTISTQEQFCKKQNSEAHTDKLDNLNEIAWKTGVLEFSNTPLRIAIPEIEKFYKKTIIVEDGAINDCLLNAKLDRYAFDNVLEMFKIAFGIDIVQKDSVYYLSGKGCE